MAAATAARRPFLFTGRQAQALLSLLAPLCGARISTEGDALLFQPGCERRGGAHRLSLPAEVPAAAAVAALASALASAQRPVSLHLSALTHPVQAPSFHELVLGWGGVLDRMGLSFEAALEIASFGADPSGVLAVRFFPSPRVKALELTQRGLLSEVRGVAFVSPREREAALRLEQAASRRLRMAGMAAEVDAMPLPTRTRAAAVVVDARFEKVRASFTRTCQGDDLEQAAAHVVDDLQAFMAGRGAVPAALAEHLLVPAAMAASRDAGPGTIGGEAPSASRFTTSEVTVGLLAGADVVRALFDVEVLVQGLPGHEGLVQVRPRSG